MTTQIELEEEILKFKENPENALLFEQIIKLQNREK